jgi:hypothetical protein
MSRLRTCTAALMLLLVTACSEIPDSGPLVVVDGSDQPTPASPGRVDPAPPAPGSTPTQIVRDFMAAMEAYPVSSDVAREFLTEAAAESWDPSRGTVVYQSADFGEAPGGRVDMQVVERARIGSRGTFTPQPAGSQQRTLQWQLRRQGGEWRIANPSNLLYVGAEFFEDYYSSYNLYFLDPSQTIVVAEPAYFPSGDQLATNLVRALLAGPSSTSAAHVRTAFPSNERLDVPIPVRDDGLAEVRLTGPEEQLTELQARLVSVQVVTTLRQVPGVLGVRIVVNGTPLEIGGEDIQEVSTWGYYDPAANRIEGRLFALASGGLQTVEGFFVAALADPVGPRRESLSYLHVQEATDRLLGVSSDRLRLLSGPIDPEDGPLRPAEITGADFGRPTEDRGGGAVVPDRAADGSSLVVVDTLGVPEARRLLTIEFSGLRVERFAISPDGMRFLAVVTPAETSTGVQFARLMTGWLDRDPDGRISGVSDTRSLTIPGEQLSAVRDAGWVGQDAIALIGRFADSPYAVYTVNVDGSQLSGGQVSGEPLPEELDPVWLATDGLEQTPVYAAGRDGRLWLQNEDGEWRAVTGLEGVRSASFAG